MGIEVLVVQHGEKVRTAGDPGLTPEGRAQAAATAAWLIEQRPDVAMIRSSPMARAFETADPIATALGLELETDERLRERMNWDDDTAMSIEEFLADWHRASTDRMNRPATGDSSATAATRFLAALADIETMLGEGTAIVVAHGGVTVDTIRSVVGDDVVSQTNPDLIADGVPCCAITRFAVDEGHVTLTGFPETTHLDRSTQHRPA